MKICGHFQSVFTFMADAQCKAQRARGRNMDTVMEISAAHGHQSLLYSLNKYKPKQHHSFLLRSLALSQIGKLENQWLPSYHINMIVSNILSLGSLFSQHHPLDTLCGRFHTIEHVFEAEQGNLRRTSM